MKQVMVVAGEASGDMHAAKVIEELKELNSELEFFGMGGQQMAEAGVDILYDPTELSVIGFWESLKHIGLMYKILNKLERAIKDREPDVVLLVDFSGFNLKMAKRTAKLDVPTVNYFAPSAWVWGTWRAKKMAKYGVKIASVFPMEEEVYREVGADVEFVGHPLVDMVSTELAPAEFKEKFNLATAQRTIGLLPGSRQQEIDSLLEPMLGAAELIAAQYPDSQFLLPVADTISEGEIADIVAGYDLNIKLIPSHSYEVMEAADLLLSTSGTATLEAAFFATPMVIIYKTSWLSYAVGKLVIKIPYIGLPNIIAEEKIVPELLQGAANSQEIAEQALNILDNPAYQQEIETGLKQVKEKLGTSGAVQRVAKLVLKTGGMMNEIC